MEKTAMIRDLLFCLDMERRQTLRPKFEKLGLTPGSAGSAEGVVEKDRNYAERTGADVSCRPDDVVKKSG